jgi:hypothetical protein
VISLLVFRFLQPFSVFEISMSSKTVLVRQGSASKFKNRATMMSYRCSLSLFFLLEYQKNTPKLIAQDVKKPVQNLFDE